jgi:hypothetical protein
MLHASLLLMNRFRPEPASAFTTASLQSRVWVLSTTTASFLQPGQFDRGYGRSASAPFVPCEAHVGACDCLLREVLPVLQHVVSAAQGPHCTSAPVLHALSLQPPGQDTALQHPSQALPAHPPMPTEEGLYLLTAAARTLAIYSGMCNSTRPNAPYFVGPVNDAGSLASAMQGVLSLAHVLVSNNIWWQEAQSKHPLTLVSTLYQVSMVRGRFDMAFSGSCNAGHPQR